MAHLNKSEITHMQIKRIEKEIRDTPYHKGTEHHIGRLRARLSKLREQFDAPSGKSGGGGGYAVRKQGHATVVLVGPPSAGKSTLLNALTNAESKVAPYAFTTVAVIPGMMKYRGAYIQILDVPGLIEGAEEGKGRGREVLSVARGADLLLLMSDVSRPQAINRIETALERNGIRVDKTPPDVRIEKKLKGGLSIKTNIKQNFSAATVREIAEEMGIKNAEIQINEKMSLERLIDAFSKNRVYIPALRILNKADKVDLQKLNADGGPHESAGHPNTPEHGTLPEMQRGMLKISAETGMGLSELRSAIWEALGLITIYLVRPDQEPGTQNPLITKKGSDLQKVAEELGSDFAEDKKRAKIWGPGAKFPGQEVSLTTNTQDGMMVRFI